MSLHNFAYVMQGVPGSGKSTTAHAIASCNGTLTHHWIKDAVVYYSNGDKIISAIHSTDNFFINEDGEYHFDPRMIGAYHEANLRKYCESLDAGIPIVICDNTNTTKKEYGKYISMAIRRNYIASMVTLPIPPIDVCVERNTHGVPRDVIEKMIKRMEPFSG